MHLKKLKKERMIAERTKASEEIIKNLNYSRIEPMCIDLASRIFECSVEDMYAKIRVKNVILARSVVYVYLRELDYQRWSLSTLGRIFKQNHATVINALKKHYNEYGEEKWNNKTYTDTYNAFKDSINSLMKDNGK